ncbi:MAG TPA: hypothetical protein VJT73_13300, partial [Polyangiaceae bacterium]|nr:hypothetical protein [Polyangiaceae bacterium]
AEEEVATSAPPQVTRAAASAALGSGGVFGASNSAASAQASGGSLTGARDEQSVLFSLNALTGGTKPAAAPSLTFGSSGSAGAAKNDDSGLIDLNALANAQKGKPVEATPLALSAPTPFLFPAALGTVEAAPVAGADAPKKSSMPLLIGGGIAIAGIAIAIALFSGGKKEEIPAMPVGAAPSAVAPTPEPVVTAVPTPTAETPAPAASAEPAANKGGAKRPAGGGGKAKAAPAAPGPAAPAVPAPPPKPKSPCGCGAGDLQCQIRCSATGH